MNFLRKYWCELGAFLAIIVSIYVYVNRNSATAYQNLMWLSLISLFLHQLEEYRIVGTFPGMVNTVIYASKMPDRYPLNTNSAFYVNVVVGWTFYALAAVFSDVIWLGMATILVSVGNVIGHAFVFNFRAKTIYNAGLATSLLLFLPCTYFFISIVHTHHLATERTIT